MDKETRRIMYMFIGLILGIILENITKISYQKVVFERDMYARMYYKEIGDEDMLDKFEVDK